MFIDEEFVRQWVEDLVITKTYTVYMFIKLYAKLLKSKNNYRLAI